MARLIVAGCVLAVLGFMALAGVAWAHGTAHWIQFSPTASWCCTAGEDCLVRSPDFAVETADGWRVKSTGQVFREGDRGLFKSASNDLWACLADDGTVRCLFVPGSGA